MEQYFSNPNQNDYLLSVSAKKNSNKPARKTRNRLGSKPGEEHTHYHSCKTGRPSRKCSDGKETPATEASQVYDVPAQMNEAKPLTSLCGKEPHCLNDEQPIT